MFDPILRPLKERLLAPLGRGLGWASPGALTGCGLVTGLGAALAGWTGAFGAGFVLWIVSRIFDGLDGWVARERGLRSDLGGLMDLVADYLVYAAVPVALALRPGAPEGLETAALLLIATFYVNSAAWMVPAAILERRGRGAEHRGEPTTIVIPEGLISGGETIVFYALFFLLPDLQLLLFQVMAALTALTVVQRVVWARRTFSTRTD